MSALDLGERQAKTAIAQSRGIRIGPESGQEMLRVMAGLRAAGAITQGLNFGIDVDVDGDVIEPPVDGDILKVILRAMAMPLLKRKALMISYMSRRGSRYLIVSPSVIVSVSGRHHVRALDHHSELYKDFVISLIAEVAISNSDFISKDDMQWRKFVSLQFLLNQELPQDIRIAYGTEWRLPDTGILKVQCREALSRYAVAGLTKFSSKGLRKWLPADRETNEIFEKVISGD